MQYYYFILTPANKKLMPGDFNFKKVEEETSLFSDSEKMANNGAFKRDGKKVTIEEITENFIRVKLSCLAPLPNAGRSLSTFSRAIMRHSSADVLKNCIYYNSLFNCEMIEVMEQAKDNREFSDTEFLKATIDLLFSNSIIYTHDPERRKATIDKLKELLLPYMENTQDMNT